MILDELGAGTDPQEGAALARALLSHVLERGITTLVTTHHPELKAYAHATPGVVNASVEFDLNTLRPTFHLTIGLPGRSNALAIAQRLGMPTAIIEDARTELHPDDLRAESMLDEIHRQRDAARKARGAADRAKHESEKMRGELTLRLDKIEDERQAILEKARAEAEAKIQTLEEELKETRRQLARARQPLDVVQAVEEKVESLQETVEQPVERRAAPMPGDRYLRRSVQLGDKVHLKSLNTKGIVTALGEEEAEVQVGMLRIRARLTDLQPVSPAAEPVKEPGAKTPAAEEIRHRAQSSGRGDFAGRIAGHRAGPARPDHRGGAREAGALPGQRLPGGAAVGAHHPRQGHRQAAPGRAPGAQRAPAGQILRAGRGERGRRWGHGGEIDERVSSKPHPRPLPNEIPIWREVSPPPNKNHFGGGREGAEWILHKGWTPSALTLPSPKSVDLGEVGRGLRYILEL